MIEKRWSRAGAAWMREVRIADTTTAASRSCLRERQTKSTKGSGVFDFKSPAKSQRPRPGLICLGPGGTKPWLDLFEGLESIVIPVSYQAPTAAGSYSSRPEGACT